MYIVVCRRLLDVANKMVKVGEQANESGWWWHVAGKVPRPYGANKSGARSKSEGDKRSAGFTNE